MHRASRCHLHPLGTMGAHGGIVPWFGAGGIVLQGPVPKFIPAGVPPSTPDPCCCSGSCSETGGTRLSRGLDFLEVFRIRFSGCFSAGWKASSPCRSHGSEQNFPLKMSDYSKYGEKKKKKAWQRMPHRNHPSLGRRFPAVGSFAGMEAVLLLVLFIYFYFFPPSPESKRAMGAGHGARAPRGCLFWAGPRWWVGARCRGWRLGSATPLARVPSETARCIARSGGI